MGKKKGNFKKERKFQKHKFAKKHGNTLSDRKSAKPTNDTSGGTRRTPTEWKPAFVPQQLKHNHPQTQFLTSGDEHYSEALAAYYEGFTFDLDEVLHEKVHGEAAAGLRGLEAAGAYRTDVTQPFGLGTACARTYVTRCLVGAPGTTYKYLGLRMFSHPWSGEQKETPISKSVKSILRLNQALVKRSEVHLKNLRESRGERCGEEQQTGDCNFNVVLINRMLPMSQRPDLKHEPEFQRDKMSVSWHADSSLKNFSTIAVYHLLEKDSTCEAVGEDWRVALRVTPDAEGPNGGKKKPKNIAKGAKRDGGGGGGGEEGANYANAPKVAASLPSRATYYLLDDFNHHHQHAVLAGEAHRYASTHRVLKEEGHTFDWVAGRCRAVLGGQHKKTLKQWRSEQAMLTELESEWIRQFYIQGEAHRRLHPWWTRPVAELCALWGRLEARTGQVVAVLVGASLAVSSEAQGPVGDRGVRPSGDERKKRKQRDKIFKHLSTVKEMEQYSGQAYEVIHAALEERQKMRLGWKERERDKVFKQVAKEDRPLPCPLFEEVIKKCSHENKTGSGQSTRQEKLDVTTLLEEDLSSAIQKLKTCWNAYVSFQNNSIPITKNVTTSTIISDTEELPLPLNTKREGGGFLEKKKTDMEMHQGGKKLQKKQTVENHEPSIIPKKKKRKLKSGSGEHGGKKKKGGGGGAGEMLVLVVIILQEGRGEGGGGLFWLGQQFPSLALTNIVASAHPASL